MRLSAFYVTFSIVTATASPLHHVSLNPRGLVTFVDNAADEIRKTADHAIPAVSRALMQISKTAAGALPKIARRVFDLPDNFIANIPPEVFANGTVGNAALWEEAVSIDTRLNAGTLNQMFYRLISYLQKIENGSIDALAGVGSGVSYIGQGLQFLHIYPGQFDQPQAALPAETLVRISSVPQQTIQSFGASGAWWPNYLNDFPPEQQKNLSSLLFSKDWLHLSGYRYNLGASGGKDSQAVTTPGRGVESFMLSDGSYDWLRDKTGVYFLKTAQEAGVPSIAAFANAMPAALTAEKKPCGTSLIAETIPAFVNYITEVLAHFSEQDIRIDYISPMNEPDNNFDTCTQEGMAVQTSDRAAVFNQLRSALQNSTTAKIKIMGDETSQVTPQALVEYATWLPAVLSTKSIDAISVHMYDWPDDAILLKYRQLVTNLSAPSPPPPIKMTEISTFTTARDMYAPWGKTGPKIMGAEYDPSIHSALDMARFIWQWLTLANAESWDWWTAVSNMMPCSPSKVPGCATTFSNTSVPAAFNDGLLYIDPAYATTEDYTFYFTKRFWVFKHFTNFLRPGAVRFDVPNALLPYGTVAVAARNTDGVHSTIFINRNVTEQVIRMELPGGGGGGKIVNGVQTTDEVDFENLTPLPVIAPDGTFTITLPAKGVLTLQFSVSGDGGGVVPARRKTRRRILLFGRERGEEEEEGVS
ncbi:MAG: hypothetical protein LQ344_006132 [Seirophora lacunosa]|nr:MAG: hypothetical protein LQ344_006132 [Seirophora lacunosa]